ncbi:MAG: exodeoxyribonuclease VII small subunit [Treponema sp.]|nr:exodeoxyribonuclease VII small subunit [Treponema sp.]
MKTFEDDLKRLEELTAAIKQSDISLEDALKDFEEGIKLAKGMEKELDSIESKIQILMNAPAEEPAEEASKPKKARAKKEDEGPTLELFNPSNEITGTRNG